VDKSPLPGGIWPVVGNAPAMPGGVGATPGGLGATPGGLSEAPGGLGAPLDSLGATPGGLGEEPGGFADMPGGLGEDPLALGPPDAGGVGGGRRGARPAAFTSSEWCSSVGGGIERGVAPARGFPPRPRPRPTEAPPRNTPIPRVRAASLRRLCLPAAASLARCSASSSSVIAARAAAADASASLAASALILRFSAKKAASRSGLSAMVVVSSCGCRLQDHLRNAVMSGPGCVAASWESRGQAFRNHACRFGRGLPKGCALALSAPSWGR